MNCFIGVNLTVRVRVNFTLVVIAIL